MTLSEVVALLGKPQRDIGSGMIILEWDLKDDRRFCVSILQGAVSHVGGVYEQTEKPETDPPASESDSTAVTG